MELSKEHLEELKAAMGVAKSVASCAEQRHWNDIDRRGILMAEIEWSGEVERLREEMQCES